MNIVIKNLLVYENKLIELIHNNIKRNFELEQEIRKDPLSHSILHYILLKNNIESVYLENLNDWMNSWIQEIILDKKFNYFADREITSAILGFYTLKTYNMLRIEVKEDKINEIINKFTTNNSLFNNFTYTCIILFSVAKFNEIINNFERLFNWTISYLKKPMIFNDAKNLVFFTILLKETNRNTELEELISICFQKLKNKEIRYVDRIYYGWTLWQHKDIVRSQQYPEIFQFVYETLQNLPNFIKKEEFDSDLIEIYGISKLPKLSKIMLGISLDLLISFNQSRLVISLESKSYIDKKLLDLGWQEIIDNLNEAIIAFEKGQTDICCYNLRMGLITLLVKIYEKTKGQDYPLGQGKTPNPKYALDNLTEKGLKTDSKGLISQIWSYVTERSHTEKLKGKKPSEYETRFCLKLVFSQIEFILRFLDEIE